MIKLLIFDIDDTLFNEIDYVKSGYKVVADFLSKKFNKNKNEIYRDLMNLFNENHKNVFNRLMDLYCIKYTDDDIKSMVNLYKYHKPDIKLSDDVLKTLAFLKTKYKLAIISDGNYKTQKLKCDALGLDKYFNKIILTDKLGKEYWKPNIAAFNILKEEFNLSYDEMIYIGDNPNKDFYISKYGIKTVRYYNENGVYYNDQYLNNIKEDYKINNICEIKELF